MLIKRKDWMRILCFCNWYMVRAEEPDEESVVYEYLPDYEEFNKLFWIYKFKSKADYKKFINTYSAPPNVFFKETVEEVEEAIENDSEFNYIPHCEKGKGFKFFSVMEVKRHGQIFYPDRPTLYYILAKLLKDKTLVVSKMNNDEITLHYRIFKGINEEADDVVGISGVTQDDIDNIKRAFGFFKNPDYLEEDEEDED